ncbi:TerB family tellurite resistance protein [bacterium]|nr:MAG: TerB family tellurite resistance protein [bacterium]
MVIAIKQFFEKYIKSPAEEPDTISEHSLQLATAVLLVEIMRADAKVNEDEQKTIISSVRSKFHLNEEEIHTLIELAHEKHSKSTDYYEFTSLINKGFTYEQKVRVVEHMWEVAFADAELDKHEEHIVRKIANLLFVKHKDFIDAKLRVRKEGLST